MSGIHRDVTLVSRPKTYLRDFYVVTDLDETYTDATLKLDLKVKNSQNAKAEKTSIKVTLFDQDKSSRLWQKNVEFGEFSANEEKAVKVEKLFKNPLKWTAETPNLYVMLFEQFDANGKLVESIARKIGFREVEIIGGIYKINGVHVKMKGVNRHDMHPTLGQAITEEVYREELELMKQYNINAVRTAHYPNPTVLYDIADEIGLYVMDEANMEFNVANERSRNRANPKWTAAFVDRMAKMVERDKNNPSVVFYSLGNEACAGNNFKHMKAYADKNDPTRPLHYDKMNHIMDVESKMYPHVNVFRSKAKAKKLNKPFMALEYGHAMGNAMGNLDLYWEAIESSPYVLGGYIWDWRDQGLVKKNDKGEEFYAYGGDFGEKNHSGDFCLNGIMLSDLTPTSKSFEVKKVYDYLNVTAENAAKGQFNIQNAYYFKDLSDYVSGWEITEDGKVIKSGTLNIASLPAGKSQKVTIPVQELISPKPGADYQIKFTFKQKESTGWAPKGYLQAWDQFHIPMDNVAPKQKISGKTLKVTDDSSKIAVVGSADNSFEIVFDKKNGTVSSWKVGGKSLIDGSGFGPVLNTYRAKVSNTHKDNRSWKGAGLDDLKAEVKSVKVSSKNTNSVTVETVVNYQAKGKSGFEQKSLWTVWKNGQITFDSDIKPYGKLPRDLPRVGMLMKLPKQFDNFTYYGRGPHENYNDKKESAAIGLYSTKVADTYVDYASPQGHGNHEDVNWTALADNNGFGFLVKKRGQLTVKATNYSAKTIEDSKHPYDLKPVKETLLYLNARVTGIGNGSCGPGVLDQYRIKPEPMQFGFELRPFTEKSEILGLARQSSNLPSRPVISRDDEGMVTITSSEKSKHLIEFRTKKSKKFQKYAKPFEFGKGGQVEARIRLADKTVSAVSSDNFKLLRKSWKIHYVDSLHAGAENRPENAIDGNPKTIWHTNWDTNVNDALPHEIQVDMREPLKIKGVTYTPRQDNSNGRIKDYEVYVSKDGKSWGKPMKTGQFPDSSATQEILFGKTVEVRYIRIVATSEVKGNFFTTIAEFSVISE